MKDLFHSRVIEMMGERKMKSAQLSKAAGVNVTFVRDMLERGSAPRIDSAALLAKALGTSVAYLIGETDDASPTVTLRTTSPEVPETVLLVNAGAVLASREVAVSFDVEGWGEQGFLLSEADALVLRERLDYAVRDLHENQRSALVQSS